MASSTVAPSPNQDFKLSKNLPLNPNASLGFTVTAASAPDVLAALAANQPFPARDIDLAEVSLTASTPQPIEFADGASKIDFTASGGAYAGFGVYHTGAALNKQLGDHVDDFSLDALEFNVGAGSMLTTFRWGYTADVKASGSMALGAVGSATLSVAGNAEGLYAVIRRLDSATPSRAAIQQTADSWILPRQVRTVDQLQPGTWVVAEVLGGISAKLGAQVGFDFSWVRAAQLGGLTGDIGLRLQTAIDASIGFSASGRFAVVVNRESADKLLRVRYFRLKTRQLDVAFDAKVSATVVDTLLPAKIDDFIAGVFDVHGQQILHDLQVLEKWTDPTTSLSTLLAGAGIDGAENLIAKIAGVTPATLQADFDAIQQKAVAFIQKWHDLPHSAASSLLKMVEDKVDLGPVRDLVQKLSTITPDSLRDLLNTELNSADFFHTPVGKFLESIADNGVLDLLQKPIAEVQQIGQKALAILDGSTIEKALQDFQSYIETEFHLDKVLQAVTATDFASLDALLKKKLATFLGTKVLALADLDKIRKTIGLLIAKKDEFYEKVQAALNKPYGLALSAAFQSVDTTDAMFDATFDFSRDPGTVATFLDDAMRGNLDRLLTAPPAQVTLGAARLSHGIKRQASLDLSLPFFKMSEKTVNTSVATMSLASGSDGLLFSLSASDTIATNQRKSILSFAMGLYAARPDENGIRLHDDSLELNYSSIYAKRKMKVKDVRAQIVPAVTQYFASNAPTIPAFLNYLDQRTEEEIPNTPGVLGDGLVSLQVSLSANSAKNAGKSWMGAPADPKSDTYVTLSRDIQVALKQAVHDSHFVDSDAYTDLAEATTVLVYCSLVPRATRAKNANDLPYWDWVDPDERRNMLLHPVTIARMTQFLQTAQDILGDDSQVGNFRPADAAKILGSFDQSDVILNGFLFAEAELIKHAFQAGLQIAPLAGAAVLQPTQAVDAMVAFGAKLSEAFNSNVTSLLGAGMRAIGTKVFLAASRALSPADAAGMAEANAILDIEFLKPGSKFDASVLLDAGHVDPALLAVSSRLVGLEKAAVAVI